MFTVTRQQVEVPVGVTPVIGISKSYGQLVGDKHTIHLPLSDGKETNDSLDAISTVISQL